jgi:hypothetical protein
MRDSAYFYPAEAGQLPSWLDPVGFEGVWQAASNSKGAAWINHPQVKGVVYTADHGHGMLDYRAQGPTGSGLAAFIVEDPSGLYTYREYGEGRGGTGNEYWQADGPQGFTVRNMYVYDPDQMAEVLAGSRDSWVYDPVRTEVPMGDLPVRETGKSPTATDGLVWDDARQLLWVSYRWLSNDGYCLVAYQINPDAAPAPSLNLMDPEWHVNQTTGLFERITPIGSTYNGLSVDGAGNLTWDATTFVDHDHYGIMHSTQETTGFTQIVTGLTGLTYTISDPGYYLVVDYNAADEGHAIRGKVLYQP